MRKSGARLNLREWLGSERREKDTSEPKERERKREQWSERGIEGAMRAVKTVSSEQARSELASIATERVGKRTEREVERASEEERSERLSEEERSEEISEGRSEKMREGRSEKMSEKKSDRN